VRKVLNGRRMYNYALRDKKTGLGSSAVKGKMNWVSWGDSRGSGRGIIEKRVSSGIRNLSEEAGQYF